MKMPLKWSGCSYAAFLSIFIGTLVLAACINKPQSVILNLGDPIKTSKGLIIMLDSLDYAETLEVQMGLHMERKATDVGGWQAYVADEGYRYLLVGIALIATHERSRISTGGCVLPGQFKAVSAEGDEYPLTGAYKLFSLVPFNYTGTLGECVRASEDEPEKRRVGVLIFHVPKTTSIKSIKFDLNWPKYPNHNVVYWNLSKEVPEMEE